MHRKTTTSLCSTSGKPRCSTARIQIQSAAPSLEP
jgi:hypothetical protein